MAARQQLFDGRMVVSQQDVLGTPTIDSLPRRFADFDTLVDALEYAAEGVRGINIFTPRGALAASLTYAQLRDRAEALGRRLTAFGVAKGDRVAMIAETSADFVIDFLG